MGEPDLFSGIPTWDYLSLQTTVTLGINLSTTETERQSKSLKTAWVQPSASLHQEYSIYLLRTHSWTETAPSGPTFKQGVASSSLQYTQVQKTAHTHMCAGQLCSSNMWLLFLLRGQHKRHLLSCCLYYWKDQDHTWRFYYILVHNEPKPSWVHKENSARLNTGTCPWIMSEWATSPWAS